MFMSLHSSVLTLLFYAGRVKQIMCEKFPFITRVGIWKKQEHVGGGSACDCGRVFVRVELEHMSEAVSVSHRKPSESHSYGVLVHPSVLQLQTTSCSWSLCCCFNFCRIFIETTCLSNISWLCKCFLCKMYFIYMVRFFRTIFIF